MRLPSIWRIRTLISCPTSSSSSCPSGHGSQNQSAPSSVKAEKAHKARLANLNTKLPAGGDDTDSLLKRAQDLFNVKARTPRSQQLLYETMKITPREQREQPSCKLAARWDGRMGLAGSSARRAWREKQPLQKQWAEETIQDADRYSPCRRTRSTEQIEHAEQLFAAEPLPHQPGVMP